MTYAALLHPIAPHAPCGEDLSFSPEFDALVEKRREDDPTLDPGAWVRPLKMADWPGVVAQCEALLRERTKDLRLAAWWTDASARLRGPAGLADGLELCARFCEERWDELHPRRDDGDADPRAGSLAWLLAQVTSHARRFAPAAVDAADARRAREALDRLERGVDERLGDDGPSFVAARQALDDARAAAEALVRQAAPDGAGEPDGPRGLDGTSERNDTGGTDRAGPADETGIDRAGVGNASTHDPALRSAGPDARATGGPRSRAEALRQLRSVAEFFRRTEPHSPVAYLADKAADWADLPLHVWLRAVLRDEGALARVEELLGVKAEVATP